MSEDSQNRKRSDQSIFNRYFLLMMLLGVSAIWIVLKAGTTMFLEKDYWLEAMEAIDTRPIEANRGNIFSCDGRLLASSIPQYKLYMDYKGNNSIIRKKFEENIEEVSQGLHRILPDRSAAYFKKEILKGVREGKDTHSLLYPHRISYIKYQEICKLPVFNSKNMYTRGLKKIEYNYREKPFKSLASTTIGNLFPDKTKGAINGLEKSFHDTLKGIDGSANLVRVKNKKIEVITKKPIDGNDIITTLDVDIQDISEQALLEEIKSVNAELGIVIVLEVKTGDIKAIVNMSKVKNGIYAELQNNAVRDLYEPGSTFKTVSILTALNDKKITRNTTQYLGNGLYKMHNAYIRDWNWRTGGFENKYMNIDEIMMQSSNIGVAVTIEEAYADDQQKFIDGIKKLIGFQLNLQLEGVAAPRIKDTSHKDFWKTTVPWMSFGYETQIPSINMVTFYNAIANNGVMVNPRLVTAISKDGKTIDEFPVEILNNEIASKEAIKDIQKILELVVEDGTARKYAKSDQFKIAGKTGTAQLSQGAKGYNAGNNQHLLSFCGYFPADNPQYTILVNIKSAAGGGGGGGREPAKVFKTIAEKIYAMNLKKEVNDILKQDTLNVHTPHVKKGLASTTAQALNHLKINHEIDKSESKWNTFESEKDKIRGKKQTITTSLIPNVIGMGAKDAIYALESAGLNVKINGRGKVYRQSIPNGSRVSIGATITIDLR